MARSGQQDQMIPTVVLLLLSFATFGIYFYIYLTSNFKYWKKQNVDYVKPTFPFGNVYKVITCQQFIGNFLYDLYKSTTKPYLGYFNFLRPILLIRDPELIKRVFIKDFDHFDDRSFADNRRHDLVGCNLLFLLKNPEWRKIRPKLTPIFATGRIKNMAPLILEAAKPMIDYIEAKSLKSPSLPVREISMRFTTDVISSCAFGIRANSFLSEDAEFRKMSKLVFGSGSDRSFNQLAYFIAPFLVKFARMKFMDDQVVDFMRDIFKKALAERMISRVYKGDLIDVLLNLKETNESLTDLLDEDMMTSQALQFFAAGFETSGSTIYFALTELARNSEVQTILRENICSTLEAHECISYEALQEMKYLDMVVCETLRRYPIVVFLDRECTKTYKIPNTDIIIKKGMAVYISLMGLHMDPKYFPDPEKFDPERFSSKNKDKIPNYVYMPFGEGLHNCIGTRFALVNVKIGIISILLNYEIECAENTTFPIQFQKKSVLMSSADQIHLKFKKISTGYGRLVK